MKSLLFIFILCIAACRNIETENNSAARKISINHSTGSSANNETDFTKDSIITIKFPKDSSSTTITCRMNGINKPITVNIPVTVGNRLTLQLFPEDSVANIRINQVFMPNGKADGPFGRKMEVKISQQGNYKVIVGENLMQGDEWRGIFKLAVKVE